MNMLTPDKNTRFRPDFDVGEAMAHRCGVSKRGALSRPSDFATGAEPVAIVPNELNPTAVTRQRDKQYA